MDRIKIPSLHNHNTGNIIICNIYIIKCSLDEIPPSYEEATQFNIPRRLPPLPQGDNDTALQSKISILRSFSEACTYVQLHSDCNVRIYMYLYM